MRGLFLGLIMRENRLPVFSDYLGGPALQSGSVFLKSGAVAFSAYGEVCD